MKRKTKSSGRLKIVITLIITVLLCFVAYNGIGISKTVEKPETALEDSSKDGQNETDNSAEEPKDENADKPTDKNADKPADENTDKPADTEKVKEEKITKKYLGVSNIKLGLDLSGGVYIVYEADKEDITEEDMSSAVQLLRERLDRRGYTEAEVAKFGDTRIRVDIPGVDDAEKAVSEIGQTAQLKFIDMAGNEILSGTDVKNAYKQVGQNQNGVTQTHVALEFTEEGTEKFAKGTSDNVGKQIAIVLDNNIISAPTVNQPITDGKAVITGSFTPEEAEELGALIKSGSLPFNLNIIEMNNIGAKLGANALNTGIIAGVIGFILVCLFMLLVYKISGLVAVWSLIIYIGLDILVMSVFGITLTLPGIAGIILSVGMAVDANVVIFERMKEELTLGKSVKNSIKAGFSRALPAVIDGNITTLIAGIVLFNLGNGTIKGFAETLMIGIVLSMITAVFITKFLLNSFVAVGINDPKLYCKKSVLTEQNNNNKQ